MSDRVFAAGFRPTSYWWDATLLSRPETPDEMLRRGDAVIVGSSGLTERSRALEARVCGGPMIPMPRGAT